ncbi:hypothetical protein KFK09_027957 [Dendrobium nobile]|uniref:Uncharacterized protein n=1 Tax=Dendrobium nobile TaxID=94219 RepID=A0A8T3A264_DENNO|nr:hypothetical protein KFK09_027957 [Dendrobium nobile]
MLGFVALQGVYRLHASLLRLLPGYSTSLLLRLSLLSDRKLRHFDRKQEQELASCEGNILPFARFFG